jgi:hypothetical protein
MRKTVISAAAAATIGLTGLAFAQDQQSGQEKQKPATGQMERSQGSQRATGVTGKEGPAVQAQGQTGEKPQGQRGKMGANAERANEGAATRQRQGEAQRKEPQTQKEQADQAGKEERGVNRLQTERGPNAREPRKAAEGQNRMQGAQSPEGQQRAGETNSTENGQPTQTERGGMQGNAAERGGVTQQNREGAGQTATSPNREGMTREGQTSTTAGTNGGAATVEARGNAHLSNEQASHIADALRTTASPAQTSVNVNVNLDEPLAGNLELMPLPPSVVSIVPEYRGYDYVVVHDEIVIVQPSTRKVIEVIRRGGETHAMLEGGHERRLTLSQSQQRLIRDTVTREHLPEAQVGEQLSYGVTVPLDVTLEPVPQPLIVQIPMIEQYRMFVMGGDRIVLVDPDTREVVDVIE